VILASQAGTLLLLEALTRGLNLAAPAEPAGSFWCVGTQTGWSLQPGARAAGGHGCFSIQRRLMGRIPSLPVRSTAAKFALWPIRDMIIL